MRAFITLCLAVCTLLLSNAQRFSYNFRNTPISDALVQISKEHPEININLIYTELESYHTTVRIFTEDPYEAIRKVIGLNPVTVVQKGSSEFYVEALQHGRYCYVGRAIGMDNEPVAAATVMLLAPRDSTVVTYCITDDDGRFSIPCDIKEVIAKFTCIGYKPKYQRLTNFAVGTVKMESVPIVLHSVNVEAQNTQHFADRSVYAPTARQRSASQDAIDLLQRLAIRQVKVNPKDNSVTDFSGNTVPIYINSMEASAEELKGMRTADVRRVEYLEAPTDPRFHGATHVINFIVQEYEYGGYTKFNLPIWLISSFTIQPNLYSKFAYKKMIYDFYIGSYYDKDTHNSTAEYEEYTLKNADGNYSMTRSEEPLTALRKNIQIPLTFRATYKSEKTQIRNTLGFTFVNTDKDAEGKLLYSPANSYDYTYSRSNSSKTRTVSYKGNYFFTLPSNFLLDIAAQFSYDRNNTDQIYSTSNPQTISRFADEDVYYGRIKANVNKSISDKHTLFVDGIYSYGLNDLTYTGSADYTERFLMQANGWGIGYKFTAPKLTLTWDCGFSQEWYAINDYHTRTSYPYCHLIFRYSPTTKSAFSSFLQYVTFTPDVNIRMSDVLQDNEFLYLTGNPDIKSSRALNVNLSYSWDPSNKFGMSIYSKTFVKFKQFTPVYLSYDDGSALICSYDNNCNFFEEKFGASFQYTLLDGNLQLSANPEQKIYKLTGSREQTYCPFTFSVGANYYLNNFYFSGYYYSKKAEIFHWNNVKRTTRQRYCLSVGWNNSNWNLRCSVYNLFNRGYISQTREVVSPLYHSVSTLFSSDSHPFIFLSAVYTFGYGKKIERGNEVGRQSGGASAIM